MKSYPSSALVGTSMRIHFEVKVRPGSLLDPKNPGLLSGTEKLSLILAYSLAKKGWKVSFRGRLVPCIDQGVRFLSEDERPEDEILFQVCVQQNPKRDVNSRYIIAWSHSVQWPSDGPWSSIVAVSAYHKKQLEKRLPQHKIDVIPPGAVCVPDRGQKRDRLLYASSPDRGLLRLLLMWPAIWNEIHIPLSISYNIRDTMAKNYNSPLKERIQKIIPLLDQPGIIVHGALRSEELIDLQLRSYAFVYPLDPLIPHSELLSLSVLEACAAGCPPILSPVDCFPSEYLEVARFVGTPEALNFSAEPWIEEIRSVIQDESCQEHVRKFAAKRTWSKFENQWMELIQNISLKPIYSKKMTQSWLFIIGSDSEPVLLPLIQVAHQRGHQIQILLSDLSKFQGPWSVCQLKNDFREWISLGWDKLILSSTISLLDVIDISLATPIAIINPNQSYCHKNRHPSNIELLLIGECKQNNRVVFVDEIPQIRAFLTEIVPEKGGYEIACDQIQLLENSTFLYPTKLVP